MPCPQLPMHAAHNYDNHRDYRFPVLPEPIVDESNDLFQKHTLQSGQKCPTSDRLSQRPPTRTRAVK